LPIQKEDITKKRKKEKKKMISLIGRHSKHLNLQLIMAGLMWQERLKPLKNIKRISTGDLEKKVVKK